MKRYLLAKTARKLMKGDPKRVLSCFRELDACTGGFENGKLYLIGARPGMGITSFLLSMCRNMAKRGRKVVYFGLKASAEDVAGRLILQECHSLNRYSLGGPASEDVCKEITEAADRLKKLPIWISELQCPEVNRVLDSIVQNNDYLAADVIIIDGLQLLGSEHSYEKRSEELEAICREIKSAAGFLDMPIVVSTYLSKEIEEREDYFPMLCDLREYGEIEYIADSIWLLYRDEFYHMDSDRKGLMEVCVVKNGGVPCFKNVRLVYDSDRMTVGCIKNGRPTLL